MFLHFFLPDTLVGLTVPEDVTEVQQHHLTHMAEDRATPVPGQLRPRTAPGAERRHRPASSNP